MSKCEDCLYYEEINPESVFKSDEWYGIPHGICHRYPEPRHVTSDHWCGEFKSADLEEVFAKDLKYFYDNELERFLPDGWTINKVEDDNDNK